MPCWTQGTSSVPIRLQLEIRGLLHEQVRTARGRQAFPWAALARPARLPSATPVPSFTEPVVRLDLDRMDENDVTAEILWVPKPGYQLT